MPEATIVEVAGQKGGGTKTTCAVNLAAGCARAGLRVLLVESDGQGSASLSVGVEPYDGFYELVMQGAQWEAVIADVPATFHGHGTLHLVSAWAEQHRVERWADAPTAIYNRFNEPFPRRRYDVIVVDTSPGHTEVHAGLLYTADYILLPTLCEKLAIEGLEATLMHWDDARHAGEQASDPISVAKILGVIPNRFKAKADVQQANYAVLNKRFRGEYGLPLFDPIRDLTVWQQASQMRRSIYTHDMGTNYSREQARAAAREFQPVVDAVIEVVRNKAVAK